MKLKFKTLLSFTPLLLLTIPGLLSFHKTKHIDYSNKKPLTYSTWPLPCSYPNAGIVSGESAEFFTNNTFPILTVNPNPASGFQNIPSSVTVGNNQLILQTDGNLVILENGVNCWDSGTGDRPTNAEYDLFFQSDGHLVLKFASNVLWSSGYFSTCSASQWAYLTFQGDGNLVEQYPQTTQGDISDPTHLNIDSYIIATTHTNNQHNDNHKLN